MFKKVVTSVKTAWNNAVEEFEQDGSTNMLDDITNNNHNTTGGTSHQQQKVHSRHGSRQNLLKRKATLNSNLENLSLGSRNNNNNKRRRFFADIKRSVSRESLSKRSNLSISAAFPPTTHNCALNPVEVEANTTSTSSSSSSFPTGLNSNFSSFASTSVVDELKIRIYELETLVAQKDNIIKILREELTNQHSIMVGSSIATVRGDTDQNSISKNKNKENHAPGSDNSKTGSLCNSNVSKNDRMVPQITPPHISCKSRPMSIMSVDSRFDQIIDRSYYNSPVTHTTSIVSTMTPDPHSSTSRRNEVSFEVLSPIAIDLDKFISTNDPKSTGAAALVKQKKKQKKDELERTG